MLANHRGIQENEARKKCFWTGAQQSFSSGLSFYLRHLYFPQMGHDHHTCCHTVRALSSMWNSGIEVGPAATVAPANSPISSSSCFLSLTHMFIQMDPHSHSHSTLSLVSFFPPAPRSFLFFPALPRLRLHRPTLGRVPLSWPPPSHLLIL